LKNLSKRQKICFLRQKILRYNRSFVKKKVLILTEGGGKIGFGHITRCSALFLAFERSGIDAEFVINGNGYINYSLEDKKYTLFNWVDDDTKLFKISKDFDIAIIDSYLAGGGLYSKLSELLKGKVIMIDDYKRLNYPRGIVVNPSIYGDSIDYSDIEGVKYLLGKDYIILRKEFWDVPEKIINKEVRNILVTFGGAGKQEKSNEIIEHLSKRFNFNFSLVKAWENKLTAPQMLDLMLKADICISAGGQTLNELARVGVPTIGVGMVDNQQRNLKAWQERGFLKFVGRYNDQSLIGNIELAIKKMTPLLVRQKMSNTAKLSIDGQGAQRIVSYIINQYAYKY